MYKLTADLAPFTPEPTPRRRRSLRRNLLQQRPLYLPLTPSYSPTVGEEEVASNLLLTPHLPRRGQPLIQRTPEATARLSSVLEDLSALSHELSINLASGGCASNTVPERGGGSFRLAPLSRIPEKHS
jgi:hypothetical protein